MPLVDFKSARYYFRSINLLVKTLNGQPISVTSLLITGILMVVSKQKIEKKSLPFLLVHKISKIERLKNEKL